MPSPSAFSFSTEHGVFGLAEIDVRRFHAEPVERADAGDQFERHVIGVEIVVLESAVRQIVDLQVRLADRSAQIETVVGGDGRQHRQGEQRGCKNDCFTHAEDLRVCRRVSRGRECRT